MAVSIERRCLLLCGRVRNDINSPIGGGEEEEARRGLTASHWAHIRTPGPGAESTGSLHLTLSAEAEIYLTLKAA